MNAKPLDNTTIEFFVRVLRSCQTKEHYAIAWNWIKSTVSMHYIHDERHARGPTMSELVIDIQNRIISSGLMEG